MKGWQKTSFIDYPDRIATVFFFGGCNFRCDFCHNPDLVLRYEEIPEIDDDEVLHYLEGKKHLYEGVSITGGEPTLSPKMDHILTRVKQMGILVKLDTNGTHPEKVKRWVKEGLVHYVAMDIKTSPQKYPQVFLASLNPAMLWSNIVETMNFLKEDSVEYEFRSTIYPPFFEKDDLPAIKELVKGAHAYYLQSYNPKVTLTKNLDVIPLRESAVLELRDYFSDSVEKCEIR